MGCTGSHSGVELDPARGLRSHLAPYGWFPASDLVASSAMVPAFIAVAPAGQAWVWI